MSKEAPKYIADKTPPKLPSDSDPNRLLRSIVRQQKKGNKSRVTLGEYPALSIEGARALANTMPFGFPLNTRASSPPNL